MNILDIMALILMKNNGSYMYWDRKVQEYVIVFKKGRKLIPVECKVRGNHIYNVTSAKIVCKFRCE